MAKKTKLVLNAKDWTLLQGFPGGKALGRYHAGRREIRIYRGQSRGRRRDTIIHEIIHAINPRLCERTVIQLAGDITDALCQLNLNFKKGWLSDKN